MKLRKVQNSNKSSSYSYTLAVPKDLGELLPDGIEFSATLTSEGILFRPLVQEVPVWAAVGSDDDADL